MNKQNLNNYKVGNTIDIIVDENNFAYDLEIVKTNSIYLYAESQNYSNVLYQINKNTGEVKLNKKEIGILKGFKKLYNEELSKKLSGILLPQN